jgi:hypothetical protein
VVATPAWTDRGIHQYPRPPARVDEDRFVAWRAERGVVYTTGRSDNRDHYLLVIPVE